MSGQYKLECWGAQGYNSVQGGHGGYAKGIYNAVAANIMYICVGQQGLDVHKSYNNSPDAVSSFPIGMSGGGATNVTTVNRGELKHFVSNKNEVLIVAGGGGACEWAGTGGAGGGEQGIDGFPNQSGTRKGTGANQSSGGITGSISGDTPVNGTFGIGGYGSAWSSYYQQVDYGAQGGGGYFGGGGASYTGAAGGGSSYVGGVSGGSTIAGDSEVPSLSGGTEIGHTGNGACLITWIA